MKSCFVLYRLPEPAAGVAAMRSCMFRERCGRGDRQKVVGLVATRCLVQVGPRMSMRLRSQAQKIVRWRSRTRRGRGSCDGAEVVMAGRVRGRKLVNSVTEGCNAWYFQS